MPNLPAFERTWEFHTNYPAAMNQGGSDETACQYFSLWLLNLMTDKKKKAYGGTFADQGAGTVRFTPTTRGGDPFIAASANYDASDVGLKAVFVGCAAGGNNGSFTVTAVDPSGLWIEFVNGSATFATDATATMHILWGHFTVPLTVKGSSGSVAGRGAAMDGRDRWLDRTDIASNTSGNRDWFVVQTAGGAEFLFWHDTSSTSNQFEYATIVMSAELGFTGGALTTRPTALDEYVYKNRGFWTPSQGMQSDGGPWYGAVMMSADGQAFRCLSYGDPAKYRTGYGATPLLIIMEPTVKTTPDTLIPWNGNNNVVAFILTNYGQTPLYADINDVALMRVTIDKDSAAGGPYVCGCYSTAEMATSAMLGQYTEKNVNRAQNEWEIYPMGLRSNTSPARGRIGRLVDMWWSQEITSEINPQGATYPADGSGAYVRCGYAVLPWNGSVLKKH
jgi:hypothetical protein